MQRWGKALSPDFSDPPAISGVLPKRRAERKIFSRLSHSKDLLFHEVFSIRALRCALVKLVNNVPLIYAFALENCPTSLSDLI